MIHLALGSWWLSKNVASAFITASDAVLAAACGIGGGDPAIDLTTGLRHRGLDRAGQLLRDLLAQALLVARHERQQRAVDRGFELAEPRELLVGLAPHLPCLSRRMSSSVSGTNAFVHASTADVSVSMKFSSSGKGVPSP